MTKTISVPKPEWRPLRHYLLNDEDEAAGLYIGAICVGFVDSFYDGPGKEGWAAYLSTRHDPKHFENVGRFIGVEAAKKQVEFAFGVAVNLKTNTHAKLLAALSEENSKLPKAKPNPKARAKRKA